MSIKKASGNKTSSWTWIDFVEGNFTMGKVQDDVMHDWNNTPTQQHVQSFIWMKLRLLILCT
jgi:hypothetical protein